MTLEENVIEYLRQELGADLIDSAIPREKRCFIWIKPEALRKAVSALKCRYKTLRFMTLSTVDHGLDFEFLHHFHIDGAVVTLRCKKSKEDNTLESIADLIPAANFIEREISDLFGIKFINHPKPRHLILTKEWSGDRPLRKPMEGILPPQARGPAENLISTSCVIPISSLIQRRRKASGLPPMPPIALTDDKAFKEFHELIKDTGFDEKVGYDWERRRLRYR